MELPGAFRTWRQRHVQMTTEPDSYNEASELDHIRIEQARLLNKSARHSCLAVEIIVVMFAVIIWLSGDPIKALIWFALASAMVLIVFLFARRTPAETITVKTYNAYLKGHTVISGMTGLLWGGFSCFYVDWSDPLKVIIAGLMPIIITLGGMMPNATYRFEYIALASCALLPNAAFILLYAPGSLRFFGIGTLAYYGLCLASSLQSEKNTRDGILARRTQTLTEKLKQQNEDIKRANEQKTRFLATTSHDMAQPIHAQGYFIQSLRKKLNDPEQQQLLNRIEHSWQNQTRLLEGLVDMTRLDSGAIKPKILPVSLEREMAILAEQMIETAQVKSITVKTTLEPAIVLTDPTWLNRIVGNLLNNAVKFSNECSLIELRVNKIDDEAVITVSDTGPGIALADQDRIFKEYVQLPRDGLGNDNTSQIGMGLGLSIVERLVDLLDISMKFQSTPGIGTSYELRIPIYSGDVIETPVSPDDRISGSPLVLIIDDETSILEGMSSLLTDLGAQVMCGATGKQALGLLNETPELPTVLIVDKRLSDGEDGLSVIDRIREEVNETTPAILMTGDIYGLDGIEPEQDIKLMTKPVSPRDIADYLRTLSRTKSVPTSEPF